MTDAAGPFVLDVHQHVGTPLGSAMAAPDEADSGLGLDTSDAELKFRLTLMDQRGVDAAVVIPGHKYLRPHGLADTEAVNDAIAGYHARTPERFPAAVGVIEPRDGPYALEEIERIKSLGLVGISFHCRFQGVSLDNPWIARYVGRMAQLGLVPFVHVVHETPDEALWKLCQLAAAFPDVTFLALDAFGGFDGPRHCFFAAAAHDNILFDTALASQWSVVEQFIERFGAQRVLFGSDTYSHQPLPTILADLLTSSLPDADKRAVLSGNARGLLGVAQAPAPAP